MAGPVLKLAKTVDTLEARKSPWGDPAAVGGRSDGVPAAAGSRVVEGAVFRAAGARAASNPGGPSPEPSLRLADGKLGVQVMGFMKRLWGYLKQLFKTKAERAMDPEIEIEQAISEARKRDQELRNQAAKVVAHRVQLESKIEDAADNVGSARELAKKALLKAEESRSAGNVEDAEKWTRSAQSLAMRLQASETNLDSLKGQYSTAMDQAEKAKSAVSQNALRLQELAARRLELLGALQQAKMQESVNKAVESMSETLDDEIPSLERVEEKIEKRKAEAMAHAELREATPEGAESELREAVSLAQADEKLDELKAELGIA